MPKRNNAVLIGKQNKAAGAIFEMMIEAACREYRQAGIAEIEKTPEAMKPLGHSNNKGQFMACYVKKAQPDFKGTLYGGKSIVFEAKCTRADRIKQNVVTQVQAEALERHRRLGAECYVMVSFNFQRYYKIPWEVWQEMKERYGRKYIMPEDIPEYNIKLYRGMVDFLRFKNK